tara:strand:- start:206 stop:487 length:282 start_codon:yes stop_codon:yes gene_type:complete
MYYIQIKLNELPFKKLNDNGWKVYLNTYNCGWCAKQIEFLGKDIDKVHVVHCDNILNEECKKLRALPMWINKDGKEVSGALLSRKKMVEKLNL